MLVFVDEIFLSILLDIGRIYLFLGFWVQVQGLKGIFFAGAVVFSFYFVLCTFVISFFVVRSRVEGGVARVSDVRL